MKKIFFILKLSFVLVAILVGNSISGSIPDWTLAGGHQYNMVVYGKVSLCIITSELNNDRFFLYSYGTNGDNDYRSKSEIHPDGFYYATIVGSKDDEIISFRVLNSNNGEVYDLNEFVYFKADDTIADLELY